MERQYYNRITLRVGRYYELKKTHSPILEKQKSMVYELQAYDKKLDLAFLVPYGYDCGTIFPMSVDFMKLNFRDIDNIDEFIKRFDVGL